MCPHEEDPADVLHIMRHSLAHVLTQAMFNIRPNLKFSIGPPIDNGFYFDYLFDEPLTPEDFPRLEKLMRGIIRESQTFERRELTLPEAKEYWRKRQQPFKVEMVEDLEKNEGVKIVTHYANIRSDGSEAYVDLCRGGHVENTKELPLDGFKITHLAGAYWRGDERREQLTRVYVAAFPTKAELDAYLAMMEEAKQRDHRKIGKEMDLFFFSEDVGPGLPLWTPRGTIIADALEELAREMEEARGYLRVRTPHIAKGKLYEATGHLAHYRQSMFPPMLIRERSEPTSAKATVGEDYYLKPMNCPHHHQIFASRPRSYRDLPMRLAEYGHCYRYEDSGALFGLMRVRSLSMNDAHIYCSEEQFEQEFLAVIDLYMEYFKIFGIETYVMRLALHDPKELGKKYVPEPALWVKTEEMVRSAMRERGVEFTEVPNEAAFYGPKIDVEIRSAIGREFTFATNQVDFDVPRKVGLKYTAKDGSEQVPLCIHRAPLGTHERTVGFLIEHFAGHFPLWMAPVQVALLPVAHAHEEYGEHVAEALIEKGIRVQYMNSEETLGKRIREGEIQRIPYLLVLGEREMKEDTVTVRSVQTKKQLTVSVKEFAKKTVEDIRKRKLIASFSL